TALLARENACFASTSVVHARSDVLRIARAPIGALDFRCRDRRKWAAGRSNTVLPMRNEACMELAIDTHSTTLHRDHRQVRPALWRAYWKAPSDQTRNRLVEAYQPLVREIVARFAQRLPRSVDRGDLGTAGNVGLMAA